MDLSKYIGKLSLQPLGRLSQTFIVGLLVPWIQLRFQTGFVNSVVA